MAYDPFIDRLYPQFSMGSNTKVNMVSNGCPEEANNLKAVDVIRKALYDGPYPGFTIISRDLYFLDGFIVSKDGQFITICISDRLDWVGVDKMPEGEISEEKAIKFTSEMIDTLPAADFIAILRDKYRKLLERSERG